MSIKLFSYFPSDTKREAQVIYTDEIFSIEQYLGKDYFTKKKTIVITDKNLPLEYTATLLEFLHIKNLPVYPIDPVSKTVDVILHLWAIMTKEVPDCAIVLGGGTVNDLAGFACSTYQRGIDRIAFPTTYLAQVDASIGGKTGIDYDGVKNAVGSVHYPRLTVNYMPYLKTLTKEEFFSGFAETIKAAVLYDSDFFTTLMQSEIFIKNVEKSIDLLYRSAEIKARICEEKGNKKIRLLYGHAIGHALEKISPTYIRHGDAVSIGMNIEGAMACVLDIWDKKEWEQQKMLLQKYNLPTVLSPTISIDLLIEQMMYYKKLVSKEDLLFVLPVTIGKVNNQETDCLTPISKKNIKSIITKAIDFIDTN